MRRRPLALAVMACLATGSLAAGCGSSSSSSDATTTAATTTAAAPATSAPATTPAPTATTAPAPAGAAAVKVEADPSGQLAYVQKTLTASAGKDTFDFANASPVPHDFAIKSPSGGDLGVTKTITSGTATLTVTLKPGTYEYYCTVPGHEQAGMKGTLTVK